MKLIARTLAGLAGLAVLSASAGAQVTTSGTWQTMVAPNNDGSPFWDKTSDDGANCNIGFYLLYASGSGYGPCTGQRPTDAFVQGNAGKLGLNAGSPNGSYLSQGAFSFGAGQYTFSMLANIANFSVPTQGLGVYRLDGTLISSIWAIGGAFPTTPITLNIGSAWMLGAVDQVSGVVMSNVAGTSNSFALFSRSAPVNAGGVYDNYFVGFDDFTRGDRDFNDVIVNISSVPEPSTYALMAVGLAGLVAVRRRRRV